MSKNPLSAALRELIQDNQHRSATARMREVMDDIEAAIKAGVNRTAILEALHNQGLRINASTFESTLYRLRKERSQAKNPIEAKPIVQNSETLERKVATSSLKTFTHNPKAENDLLK